MIVAMLCYCMVWLHCHSVVHLVYIGRCSCSKCVCVYAHSFFYLPSCLIINLVIIFVNIYEEKAHIWMVKNVYVITGACPHEVQCSPFYMYSVLCCVYGHHQCFQQACSHAHADAEQIFISSSFNEANQLITTNSACSRPLSSYQHTVINTIHPHLQVCLTF